MKIGIKIRKIKMDTKVIGVEVKKGGGDTE